MEHSKYQIAAEHPQALDRLERRTERVGDCSEWTGARSNGYGVLSCNKQLVYAHRLSWWLKVGPIPEGLVIDHLCHNRRCVNIQHLTVTTVEENSRRYPRALASYCASGHPLFGDNLRVHSDSKGRPHRHCRTCNQNRAKQWRASAKKAALPDADVRTTA